MISGVALALIDMWALMQVNAAMYVMSCHAMSCTMRGKATLRKESPLVLKG